MKFAFLKSPILTLFALFAFFALLTLGACGEEPQTADAPVKAVKTLVIGEAQDGGGRILSGVVRASDESGLSFRVGGQVQKLAAQRGDKVKRGDILAELERQDYILAVNAAEARLQSAKSALAEAEQSHVRYQILVKDRAVSRADAERVQATYEAALSQVAVAETDVQTAKDNLQRTILRAPFDGEIADKNVETFNEVAAGQVVFLLQGSDDKEVEVSVPETLIRNLQTGAVASVTFPTLENVRLAATITQIGARSEVGNAFPVTLKLADNTADIRPGMTAEVKIKLANGRDGTAENPTAVLIPTSAVDLRFFDEVGAEEARVFIVEPTGSTLKSVNVFIGDVRGNELHITRGLNIGDRVVVAGVAFLNDGQKVKLWQPQYAIPARLGK